MARQARRDDDRGSRLAVPLSSGYTVIVRRPSVGMITAVQKRAEELFPYPQPPTETMAMVTGAAVEFATVDMAKLHRIKALSGPAQVEAVEALSDDERELLRQIMQVDAERLQYLLDYVFERRLEVEGVYTDEQKRQLIDVFAGEREEMLHYGSLPDDVKDLDDWQQTLRLFVVADQMDYAAVMAAAMMAFDRSDITPEEIRARVSYFRG